AWRRGRCSPRGGAARGCRHARSTRSSRSPGHTPRHATFFACGLGEGKRARHGLAVALVFAVAALALFAFVAAFPVLPDADSYSPLAVARAYAERGVFHPQDWAWFQHHARRLRGQGAAVPSLPAPVRSAHRGHPRAARGGPGRGVVLSLALDAGRHPIVIRTCPSEGQLGFYALVRGRQPMS